MIDNIEALNARIRHALVCAIVRQYVAAAVAVCVLLWVTGCATMVKPGMTAESKAKDRYECEQEVYKVSYGNPGMLSNGLYRDCMRARGYQ